MKKQFIIPVLFAALFFSNNTFARIWRVNNTAGVNADYTSVQTACDAASTLSGDTIHVEPSASGYGNINITKPLVVIGNGFFLTEDTILQANTNVSSFGYIAVSSGGAGTVVQGCYMSSFYFQTNNIFIRRNYIGGYVYIYAGSNNCTILDNYIAGGVSEQSGPVSSLNISNNIFNSCNISLNPDFTTGTFENNTCVNGGLNVYNFQVDNNIFYNTGFTPNNCVYFNNIGNSTQFGTANGNQQNVTMVNNVFVAAGTTDGQFVLKGGSPAIGAGYGGVDCGASGGPNPYKLAGIPNVPTIYKLTVPPTGTTNINVTISTKSNN